MSSPADGNSPQYDATFVNSRREGAIIFGVWVLALLWAVPYCYLNGYGVDPENLQLVWGVPSWLFYGVAVPWLVADVFTIVFCLAYMKDDELAPPEGDKEDP